MDDFAAAAIFNPRHTAAATTGRRIFENRFADTCLWADVSTVD
jgi:hypothetical protein